MRNIRISSVGASRPKSIGAAIGLILGIVAPLYAQNGLLLSPDTVKIHPHNSVMVNVLGNDRALGGDLVPATLRIERAPAQGCASIEDNGVILYSHTGEPVDQDTFTYSVSDNHGHSASSEVTVTFSKSLRLPNVTFNVPSDPPSQSPFRLVDAFSGISFHEPVCLAYPNGNSKQLYVLERRGTIKLVPDVTAKTPLASVFLDLQSYLQNRNEALLSKSSEQGLLGLAFHPKHSSNRQFFLFYSVRNSAGKEVERISRFTADAANPSVADLHSEVILIDQPDRAGNHQGSCLQFGPDGYLYVSLGDEGGQNDQFQNGQNIQNNFFSGILRIDVDRTPGSLEPNPHPAIPLVEGKAAYTVPADNPFLHTSLGSTWDGKFNGVAITNLTSVRTEFWATGLRNPWRMSFDSQTGELWVGDVGGDRFEEVNLIEKGGNYGWPYREGFQKGVKDPSTEETAFQYQEPVFAYAHGTGSDQGNSITGGMVVHNAGIPALEGAYLYADFLSGNVWAIRRQKGQPAKVERLFSKSGIAAFGTDPATGEILVADYTGSRVLRLVAAKEGSGFPQKLSDTGLFLKTSTLSPNRGLLPYEINHPAWNDGAISRHWFAYYATEDGEKIKVVWSKDGTWATPLGTLWVQHLDLEMEKGRPETRRRIETRLLVRNNSGAYGVTYRWNDAQTDAVLVPETGENATFSVRNQNELVSQNWRFPGQSECLVCHSNGNGNALSFSTRQMNRETVIRGFTGNQIDLFFRDGFFRKSVAKANQPPPPPPPIASEMLKFSALQDEAVALEDRARSYLAVNCAICHRPGGLSPTAWDLRPEVPLEKTGILNGVVLNHGGDTKRKIVAPGDAGHSQILTRMMATDGFVRMPLLGTATTDEKAVTLLKRWIESKP